MKGIFWKGLILGLATGGIIYWLRGVGFIPLILVSLGLAAGLKIGVIVGYQQVDKSGGLTILLVSGIAVGQGVCYCWERSSNVMDIFSFSLIGALDCWLGIMIILSVGYCIGWIFSRPFRT